MTRETSIEAYRAIVDTMAPGLRKDICIYLLGANAAKTTSEIARALNKPRDSVSPRMQELIDMDLVQEHEEKVCDVTGYNKISFWLTGRPVRERSERQKARRSKREIEKKIEELNSNPNKTEFSRGALTALRWALCMTTSTEI